METPVFSTWQRIFFAAYLLFAGFAAWQVSTRTNASTGYFDEICRRSSLGNEGAQAADQFEHRHSILGPLVINDLRDNFGFPTLQESNAALGALPDLNQRLAEEEDRAIFWSRVLMGLSLAYLILVASKKNSATKRNLLWALTAVSAVFFAVGISTSALVIYTDIPVKFLGITPVIQHQVRSISAVVIALFKGGHWAFGAFVLIFSVVTPLLKMALTIYGSLASSPSTNAGINRLLTVFSKWSMADVFVAAILLACFAIKSDSSTHVIPCRGLYYFAGYCFLSMITTSMLHKLSDPRAKEAPILGWKSGIPYLAELVSAAVFLCCIQYLKSGTH
ncbi:MAG TPA: paraquat-inducible protein A [bacterium]|jgi:hypothetical protein|nr:paraquat-inducible protein A [bacterium]